MQAKLLVTKQQSSGFHSNLRRCEVSSEVGTIARRSRSRLSRPVPRGDLRPPCLTIRSTLSRGPAFREAGCGVGAARSTYGDICCSKRQTSRARSCGSPQAFQVSSRLRYGSEIHLGRRRAFQQLQAVTPRLVNQLRPFVHFDGLIHDNYEAPDLWLPSVRFKYYHVRTLGAARQQLYLVYTSATNPSFGVTPRGSILVRPKKNICMSHPYNFFQVSLSTE